MFLTPAHYLEQFGRIEFRVGEYDVRGPVAVRRYRNADHTDPVSAAGPGIAKGLKIVQHLRDRYKRITGKTLMKSEFTIPSASKSDWFPALPLSMELNSIARTFNGKGSPHDISIGLAAAVATKVADLDTIDDFIDKFIGLDCNGFVGGYSKARGLMGSDGHLGPNSAPNVFAHRGAARNSWGEIQPHDVLLTPGSDEHIRIVNAFQPSALDVCESAKSLKGLSRRYYVLLDTSFGRTEVQGMGATKAMMYKFSRQTLGGGWSNHWALICGVGF